MRQWIVQAWIGTELIVETEVSAHTYRGALDNAFGAWEALSHSDVAPPGIRRVNQADRITARTAPRHEGVTAIYDNSAKPLK